MSKIVPAILAFFPLLFVCGCGRDSHEALRKQQNLTLRDAADTLSSIQDAPTAELAKPKLRTVQGRWNDVEKRLATLPAPTPEESAGLQKFADERKLAEQRFSEQVIRVAGVPGGRDALQEVNDIIQVCVVPAHDILRRQQLETLTEGADLLAGIRDKNSAEAAYPRGKQLMQRWQDLQKVTDVLPKLSAEQDQNLKKKYHDAFNGAGFRFHSERARLIFVPDAWKTLKEIGEFKK